MGWAPAGFEVQLTVTEFRRRWTLTGMMVADSRSQCNGIPGAYGQGPMYGFATFTDSGLGRPSPNICES